MAEITDKIIVVDPRVRQANNVTVISNTPLGREGVFELFLSVLRVHGYTLSRAGDVYTVVQETPSASRSAVASTPPAPHRMKSSPR